MNLQPLFEMQRKLDERIIKEKGLEGQDLLPKRILALQVELGELANEWSEWKFWKVNPQPKPKTLEEFIDCLHFILSIGIAKQFDDVLFVKQVYKRASILEHFLHMNYQVSSLYFGITRSDYEYLLKIFFGLGEMLGYTWGQIEQAYLEKNQENHSRQNRGY